MDPVEQTPEGVQDPTPTAPEPAAPAPSGPWANDLTSHFEDPSERARVDAFLRETVQPHVTRIEQERAQLKPAEQLYADLVENPADTYVALTEELFGEDATKAIQDQLTALFGQEDPP
jgi:predicted RNA-binding Zn ribbon-like protein